MVVDEFLAARFKGADKSVFRMNTFGVVSQSYFRREKFIANCTKRRLVGMTSVFVINQISLAKVRALAFVALEGSKSLKN